MSDEIDILMAKAVETIGETAYSPMNKAKYAEELGVSVNYLDKLLEEGDLKVGVILQLSGFALKKAKELEERSAKLRTFADKLVQF